MADVAQPANTVPSFLPANDQPATGQEQLDALQTALDPTQSPVDLVVAVEPPPPVGRSYAFDFDSGSFLRSGNAHAPIATTGLETLKAWIQKCLTTERGAFPIHPPEYGLQSAPDLFGGPVGAPPIDLEARIRDALTFHPRIANIADYGATWDPDDEYLSVSFTVVTDRDERVQVPNVAVTL
jgi:hypothetical protein